MSTGYYKDSAESYRCRTVQTYIRDILGGMSTLEVELDKITSPNSLQLNLYL